ncbi:MAG: DNA alkylation repair protein [Saprospiraceae bacterium]|nr:DNA alkylation repair protein [Saprospiraceae bacterium]
MAEPLKNVFNASFIEKLSDTLQEIVPGLNRKLFVHDILDTTWQDRELKERMRHITVVLNSHLPGAFERKVELLLTLIPILKTKSSQRDLLGYIFLPDFIEVYGLDHYPVSIKAIETITQFITCEFAVRPFLIRYPKKMMHQMLAWSTHPNPMVRRLSSEGCRPRLPWAMAIPFLKENPSPIIPILENLKKDPSGSVRRSVANNLNDISKDHPQVVIDIAVKWKGNNREIDALVKHACRTLLKQGNPELMKLFGFGSIEELDIANFSIAKSNISIGEDLEFSFVLCNQSSSDTKVRLEYAIYYQKANGSLSKKVYKISERSYPKDSKTKIQRRQHFRVITTRKLHPGLHKIAPIINGQELDAHTFNLQ